MKSRFFLGTLSLVMPAVVSAAAVDLTGQNYYAYGNTQVYSAPIMAQEYAWANGGSAGPGNPFYVSSTPGAIQEQVVIYTGASGTGVRTNVAGFDDAYLTPSGGTTGFASTSGAAGGIGVDWQGDKAGIANNTNQTWDASLASLKTFLAGGNALFMFNNNDTNKDQSLAIWARLWVTDGTGKIVQAGANDYLYLSNEMAAYGAGGDPNGATDSAAYNPSPNVVNPQPGFNATDYVLSGGNVTITDGTNTKTINHNLGANQVAYMGNVPLLNSLLGTLFGSKTDGELAGYTLHMDVKLGCVSATAWGTCDSVQIDNGYEQLWLTSSTADLQVPEPAGLALAGLGLVGLGLARRRTSKA